MTLSRVHKNTKINFIYIEKKKDWKDMHQNAITLSQETMTLFFLSLFVAVFFPFPRRTQVTFAI